MPKRIVLVDDHRVILDGVSLLLSQISNVELVGAFYNPVEALDFVKKQQVDIVISDYDMPEMNGEELFKNLKAYVPAIQVIILTMHFDKTMLQHLVEAGVDAYLTKDLGRDDLEAAIDSVSRGVRYFPGSLLNKAMQEKDIPNQSIPIDASLSEREIEVIKLTALGLSSKQVGDKMFISSRTVETHRKNIQDKLKIKGLAGIIRYAYQSGLVSIN